MKRSLCFAAIAVLAGCATVPKPSGQNAAALTCASPASSESCAVAIDTVNAAATRLRSLEHDPASGFVFNGRVAISQAGNGGNAGIEWYADSMAAYTVALSAPITAQSWRLDVTPATATVHGMKGGPRTGTDPAALLKQATGWTIPVGEMRYWVRALPAPGSAATDFAFSAGAAPRVLGFTQAGWKLTFEGGEAGGPPQRIFAGSGENKVRLVIDTWSKISAP